MKYSVIIPVYNEITVINNCLESLKKQTVARNMEIIVVDDGSTDETLKIVRTFDNINVLRQNHNGPGAARNLGASKAQGQILIFVDADMEFASDFIEKLCKPIKNGTIGTYSTQEFLLNKENTVARYWNLNFGRSVVKMDPRGYSTKPGGLYKTGKRVLEIIEGKRAHEEKNKVFRAILKDKFNSVGGFDPKVGYTDDWTVSEKLGSYPMAVTDAVYYHRSPETYTEVWQQARWFGKNEFLTKNLIRRMYNLIHRVF